MTKRDSNINVLVVDDHDLVRYGIVSLLKAQDGISVLAEASTGEQALELCRLHHDKLDVILMDINMPGIGGMEATSRISKQWPTLGIIIITVHADGPLPKKLLQAGARGYLTKGDGVSDIVQAIRDVKAGGRYIAKDIAQNLALSMLPGDDGNHLDRLSRRELQVLMMIAQGQRTQDISDTLKISPKTVSTYRVRLHEKLEVATDVEMLHLAIKHGILDESNNNQ